jgi:hypothetical protein
MTPEQLHTLIDAVILVLVAVGGALNAWTHYKVSQIPTKQETKQAAEDLALVVVQNGRGIEKPQPK